MFWLIVQDLNQFKFAYNDMPEEIDFSGGERGKFYRPGAQLQLPIHLEANVQNTLAKLANAKGVNLSVFVKSY